MTFTRTMLALAAAAVFSVGCDNQGQTTVPGGGRPLTPQGPEAANKYVVIATSCWLGGLWADAAGEPPAKRAEGAEGQCEEALRVTYGAFTHPQSELFRALEPTAITDFVARAEALADGDPTDAARKAALSKLARAVAEAQRELMLARRAAHRVRRDTEQSAADKLSADEAKAVSPLRAHAALEALLKLDAGDLSKEARSIAYLSIIDRFSFSRGLVRHLKVIALSDGLSLVFGVAPPTLPADPAEPLAHKELLTYLTEVAKAAGHPVPETATTPAEQYATAYAGVLDGIADKLSADAGGLSSATSLGRIATATATRLDQEYKRLVATKGAEPHAPEPPKP